MDFNDWFVGFIEGEGCFSTHKGRYPQFCIGQNDREILEKLKMMVNGGIVSPAKRENNWQYSAYANNCWFIRNLCEGKLRSHEKLKQFEAWKKLRWPKSIQSVVKPSFNFEDWLVGFVEAEGTFTNNSSSNGPEFSIFQKNDYFALYDMKDFFKVGSLRYYPKKHGWQYRVCGRNCWIIRDFFEDKLILEKRKRQFENWKKLNWVDHRSNVRVHRKEPVFVSFKSNNGMTKNYVYAE